MRSSSALDSRHLVVSSVSVRFTTRDQTSSSHIAEIYYFKPVSNSQVSLSNSNRDCLQEPVYVSTMFLTVISYVLGIAMENVIPRWGRLRFLNPVCATCGSAFRLINTVHKGPFQQEGAHVHSHNGKCFRNFSFGNRDSCSPAVVLQHHAECWGLHLPPIFESTPWLRYRGLDEMCVLQLSSMEAQPDFTNHWIC